LFFIFFGTGFEVLTLVRIYNVVRVRYRVVWYIVMNVLEEHSGSVFTGSQKMEAVCPDRNPGTHHPDYTVP
jgi:hypothetical protein